MKLYTRTGDDGTTGLFGGQRTTKDALRVEAYGTVDELNSTLGLAAVNAPSQIADILKQLQSRLFDLGADLCTPLDTQNQRVVRISDSHVTELERLIDHASAQVPPLKYFVLPGGSETAARLHITRTVARRAERLIVTLARKEPVTTAVIPYINRVSDLLFAMARWANVLANVEDVPWIPASQKQSQEQQQQQQ